MASKYLQLFPIPKTLPHVVRDLTREILRYQPQDIIQFCFLYFKAMSNGTEFVWNEANPRAPRPAEYKKKQSKVEENEKKSSPEPSSHTKVAEKHEKKSSPEPSSHTKVAEKHEKKAESLPKIDENSEKAKHSDHREEKKHERDIQSRESNKLNTSHLTDTSGIASLPDDHDEAANKYVENLLENVQKHIIAST